MESRSMNSSISRDFPLYHSDKIPLYVACDEKQHYHKKSGDPNVYTNEHPDMFRIDGMKESGYRNPYLADVIKVDRSEELKKMDFNRKQLNLIDFIKSKRNYSQDPNIIRYIAKASDLEIHNKREQIKRDREKLASLSVEKFNNNNNNNNTINNTYSHVPNIKYTITEPDMEYKNKMLSSLDHHIPRMDYKMKGTVDLKSEGDLRGGIGNTTTSMDDLNNFRKYRFFFDPSKSSYLRNSNDYKISEAQQRDLDKEIKYQRKPVIKYNLIKDRMEKFYPPPFRGDHWGAFMENYFSLFNDPRKFRRKGGLFSEFSDRNINVININKKDIQEKLQKEREEKKKYEMKKERATQNLNIKH